MKTRIEKGVLIVEDAFDPTPKQAEFFRACAEPEAEEILFGGAIRGGKTQAAAKQIVAWAWEYPGTYLVMRKTYRELEDSTKKAIIHGDANMAPSLPEALLKGGTMSEGYRATDNKVYLRNGSEILFRSAEDAKATEDKVKNITLAGFLIDQVEELDSDDYYQLYLTMMGRLSDPRGPRKGLCVANPGPETHWVYKRFVDEETRERYTRHVQVTMLDNPHLHHSYVERLMRRKETNPAWYRRFVLGEWGAFEGRRYGVWDPKLHVVDEEEQRKVLPGGIVPTSWEVVEAIDHGWANATCVLWIAIDHDGRWWVVDEHYENEKPVSFHAKRMKEIRERRNMSPSSVWLDPAAFNQRHQFESVAMEFYDYNIMVARAQNDRLGGWNRVEEMLTQRMEDGYPRLRIFNNCKNLIKQLPNLKIKDGTDDVEKKDDHAPDALRYAIMSRAPTPEEVEEVSDRSERYARSLIDRMHERENAIYLGG